MKSVKSTGRPFYLIGVTGHIYTNDETGDVTGIGFDHLKTLWNPAGNASAYMQLAGAGRSLTVADLTCEYAKSYASGGLSLIEFVTAIVIPRERASAVHAFEQEQYQQEHGKPWGFSTAKWVDAK